MMFTNGIAVFYSLRFLLGAAEAGFWPGVVLYLTYWFKKEQQAKALAIVLLGPSFAQIIGGPLAGAILQIHALGLKGWQWLYLVEGIPSVILGVISYFYLPDFPDKAGWLSKEEKEWYKVQPVGQNHQKTLREMLQSLKSACSDRTVIIISGTVIMPHLFGNGVLLFLPLIFRAVSGWSNLIIGIVAIFPSVASIIGKLGIGYSSDYFKERKYHTVLPILWTIVFFCLFGITYYLGFHAILVISMLCVATFGWGGLASPLWAWVSNQLEGKVNSAVSIAVVTTFGNIGSFVGPFLVGEIAGDDTQNIGWIAVFMAVGSLFFAINFFIVATYFEKKHSKLIDEKAALLHQNQIAQNSKVPD